jgi:hypothetical protein
VQRLAEGEERAEKSRFTNDVQLLRLAHEHSIGVARGYLGLQ